MNQPNVCVVGLGYVGLPTAILLARAGHDVYGVDVSAEKIETINKGELPFVEHGFNETLRDVVTSGKLRAGAAVKPADVFIIAVPTPITDDKRCDFQHIDAAVAAIADVLAGGELVILESTSPPKTCERIADMFKKLRPDVSQVLIAHGPERVLPGRMMHELVYNDRIVGGMTPEASTAAKAVYESFCKGNIFLTDAATAELAKVIENSYRDVNIAFANELSMICDELDINVWNVIELANKHPRVNILQPGPGVGGHCIAVDPWFVVESAPETARIIKTGREVNNAKPDWVIRKTEQIITDVKDPVIAIYGLSFKPNVDDFRESPSVLIAQKLHTLYPNAQFEIVEPYLKDLSYVFADHSRMTLHNTVGSVQTADVHLLLVDHDSFGAIKPATIDPDQLIDTRGTWSRSGA